MSAPTYQEFSFHPVWWWTPNGMENGYYRARILGITPYRGRYPHLFTHVLKLECPATKAGWAEMVV